MVFINIFEINFHQNIEFDGKEIQNGPVWTDENQQTIFSGNEKISSLGGVSQKVKFKVSFFITMVQTMNDTLLVSRRFPRFYKPVFMVFDV